jgi:tRNA threonylcarbamoyladenosine modification (KEOPS) complex  Pcc1 subunit
VKSQTSATLSAWLINLAQANYTCGELYRILLQNGQYITATNAQGWDIAWAAPSDSSRTYYSTKMGSWERGAIKAKASMKLEATDMDLSVVAKDTVAFPGTTATLMSVIQAGLFDKAVVDVYACYWGPYGETPYTGLTRGSEHKFSGEILQVTDLTRDKATFKVADPTYRLNLIWPRNLIQSGCRHTLFDPVCRLTQANFAFYNSLIAGSNPLIFNLGVPLTLAGAGASGSPIASKWNNFMTFSQGRLLFTSGQNVGLWYSIKSQVSTTQISLMVPTTFPVTIGDAFTLYPGCAKTTAACLNQYNNLINIGAMPFVPNQELGI